MKISKQAIDQRFSGPFKLFLVETVKHILSNQIKKRAKIKALSNHFKSVHIMDGTEMKVSKNVADKFPGYGGTGREAMVKIQYQYDLLSGTVNNISIGSSKNADSTEGMKTIDDLPKGSLLIRDLAYFSPKSMNEYHKKGLYFISRGKSQWNYYIKKDDEFKRITTAEIINLLNKSKLPYLEIDVFAGRETKIPLRLIANLLTEDQKNKRIKKKNTKGRKLGKDLLEAIGLNIFVTNVKREACKAESIYEIYRLRWQIELVFKTWKSTLNLDKIHQMNAVRLECILWLKLIKALVSWSIFILFQKFSPKELSYQKLTRALIRIVSIEQIRSMKLFKDFLIQLITQNLTGFEKEFKKETKTNDLYCLTFC